MQGMAAKRSIRSTEMMASWLALWVIANFALTFSIMLELAPGYLAWVAVETVPVAIWSVARQGVFVGDGRITVRGAVMTKTYQVSEVRGVTVVAYDGILAGGEALWDNFLNPVAHFYMPKLGLRVDALSPLDNYNRASRRVS